MTLEEAKRTPRYVCDPDKARDCPKHSCGYLPGADPEDKMLCRHTLRLDRARRDADGNPILDMPDFESVEREWERQLAAME